MKFIFTSAILTASFSITTNAASIVLNTGDAWSTTIPNDFVVHTTEITSATIVKDGVTVTVSSTGGVIEHFLNTFGAGSAAGTFDGELSAGETISFSFSESVTLTSYDASHWDVAGGYSYTVNSSTYNDIGDGTKPSQTTDSFTSITFNATAGNGGLSNLTFETMVPEPSSTALLALGSLSLLGFRRRS